MFGLDRSGALPWIIEAGKPLVVDSRAAAGGERRLRDGLPARDFGASGLFALQAELSMVQAVVGMVTITLFVPCIASLMMIVKEQGVKVAALMLAMIIPTAFFVGGVLNHGLRLIF